MPKRLQKTHLACYHPHLHSSGTSLALCHRYVTLAHPYNRLTFDLLRLGLSMKHRATRKIQMKISLILSCPLVQSTHHHFRRSVYLLTCVTTHSVLTGANIQPLADCAQPTHHHHWGTRHSCAHIPLLCPLPSQWPTSHKWPDTASFRGALLCPRED